MKNAITLILIIIMIISGAILIDNSIYATGVALVSVVALLLILYPMIIDFIKRN